ncbi:MAG: hypothetical protein CLLPBCKN_001600 [Chroococcidiopsis cubana SAG 39.79]|uniref:Probable membrane transporter protein n=1 Tax=Chroococcidiopsis cubana SAG 39.79 TaxID=388085 RepID=A0AB37UEV7_9CYAN|nr:sulfite exporter TauE/SafE family protein [Chroococcidiopsis cubana]MDZ4872212.1 hypothetical protein [Chroococcidiopsis cubana SAG 39.79]PSB63947.1 sulfite exporter TauE/SafE family protein [Chroococcidiopsis cubana CCALA 043]RUT07982.1 UPF0721 transmembrane protein [Chroococcidiopsis cubana SAG 39.79]
MATTEITQLLLAGILFVSTFIRSAIGFGDALVAMPLLVFVTEIQTATPLVALVGLTSSFIILSNQWRLFNLHGIWRLFIATFIGIPFGLILIRFAPEQLVKSILGILLIIYGSYGLFELALPQLRDERLAGIFGFIAGVLGGGYNTNGPPIVIYGTLQRWSTDYYRINLQGYFFLTNCLIVTSHALSGLWTLEVVRAYLYSLPAIAAGIFLGNLIGKRIPTKVFEKLIYGLLLALGILFIVE